MAITAPISVQVGQSTYWLQPSGQWTQDQAGKKPLSGSNLQAAQAAYQAQTGGQGGGAGGSGGGGGSGPGGGPPTTIPLTGGDLSSGVSFTQPAADPYSMAARFGGVPGGALAPYSYNVYTGAAGANSLPSAGGAPGTPITIPPPAAGGGGSAMPPPVRTTPVVNPIPSPVPTPSPAPAPVPGSGGQGSPAPGGGTGTGTVGGVRPGPAGNQGNGGGSGTGSGGNAGGASSGVGGGGAGDNAGHPGASAGGNSAGGQQSSGSGGGMAMGNGGLPNGGQPPGLFNFGPNQGIDIGPVGAGLLQAASTLTPFPYSLAPSLAQLGMKGYNLANADAVRTSLGAPSLDIGQIIGALAGTNDYATLGGNQTFINREQNSNPITGKPVAVTAGGYYDPGFLQRLFTGDVAGTAYTPEEDRLHKLLTAATGSTSAGANAGNGGQQGTDSSVSPIGQAYGMAPGAAGTFGPAVVAGGGGPALATPAAAAAAPVAPAAPPRITLAPAPAPVVAAPLPPPRPAVPVAAPVVAPPPSLPVPLVKPPAPVTAAPVATSTGKGGFLGALANVGFGSGNYATPTGAPSGPAIIAGGGLPALTHAPVVAPAVSASAPAVASKGSPVKTSAPGTSTANPVFDGGRAVLKDGSPATIIGYKQADGSIAPVNAALGGNAQSNPLGIGRGYDAGNNSNDRSSANTNAAGQASNATGSYGQRGIGAGGYAHGGFIGGLPHFASGGTVGGGVGNAGLVVHNPAGATDPTFSNYIASTRQAESGGNQFNPQGQPVINKVTGDVGISQLQPKTAEGVASSIGVPYDYDRLANDETYNRMLGVTYGRQLYQQFGGDIAATAAAYNAGPARAAAWVAAGRPTTGPGSLPPGTAAYVAKVVGGMPGGVPASTVAMTTPASMPPMGGAGSMSASDRLNLGGLAARAAAPMAASPIAFNQSMAKQTVAPYASPPAPKPASVQQGVPVYATGGKQVQGNGPIGYRMSDGTVQTVANAPGGFGGNASRNIDPRTGYVSGTAGANGISGTNSYGGDYATGGRVSSKRDPRPVASPPGTRAVYDPVTGWTVQYGAPGDTPGEPIYDPGQGERVNFLAGGQIPGPRDNIVDNHQINADEGEFVTRRASAQRAPSLLQAINASPTLAGHLQALWASGDLASLLSQRASRSMAQSAPGLFAGISQGGGLRAAV